jgi:hypothetical protein
LCKDSLESRNKETYYSNKQQACSGQNVKRILFLICKTGFLDFVHHLYLNKITAFQKLDLLPSSGKNGRTCPGLMLAQPGDPTARVSVLPFLPEDGRRSSF